MPAADLTGDVIQPELGRQVLAELADLNAGFLRLAMDDTTGSIIPARQREELRQLRKPALRRLAGCAFALFDLQLRDTKHWRGLRDGELPAAANTLDIGLFTIAALMYMRHLAEINRFMARLGFGADGDVLDMIGSMPLKKLQDIAAGCPGLLSSRFTSLPDAWTDLLRLAQHNKSQPMVPAKILGYQHLGLS